MQRTLPPAFILSKFKGCLLGGLVGDCVGAPYEGDKLQKSDKMVLQKSLNDLEEKTMKNVIKPFTDDTVLTMALTKCLIQNKSLPHKELASSYCKAYFANKNRGFGGAIPKVLYKLRDSRFENPLEPAREQFNGSGSYGNGSAMRVAPVGLFCFNESIENLIKLTKDSSIITHTHYLAVNGAILQALAVNYCAKTKPDDFKKNEFLKYLHDEIKKVEFNEIDIELNDERSEYQKQIKQIDDLLNKEPSDETVISRLGNSIAALWSVPTAIYCFLKAQNPIKGIDTENVFRRSIEYAIHLGGDTDTIACMTGSLNGALYGEELISKNLLSYCEASEEVSSMAEELFETCFDQ